MPIATAVAQPAGAAAPPQPVAAAQVQPALTSAVLTALSKAERLALADAAIADVRAVAANGERLVEALAEAAVVEPSQLQQQVINRLWSCAIAPCCSSVVRVSRRWVLATKVMYNKRRAGNHPMHRLRPCCKAQRRRCSEPRMPGRSCTPHWLSSRWTLDALRICGHYILGRCADANNFERSLLTN